MFGFRINPLTTLVPIVLIFAFELQSGVFAVEQRNNTDTKPETPLWQISSTQSTLPPLSSSIATTAVKSGSTVSSSLSPPSSASSLLVSQSARDEIYIDDEGLEGSGGRGEIHDDLEKEPEYSGSGFGPDDEDSTSSIHQRKKGYKSGSGSNNQHSFNSKNKLQEPVLGPNVEKQPEHPFTNEDDLESGSGDKGSDNEDNEDNEDDDLDRRIPQENKNNEFDTNEDEDDLTTTIDEKIEKTDDISIEKQNPDFDSGVSGGEGNEIDLDQTNGNSATGKLSSGVEPNHTSPGNEVFIMDNRGEDRTASFFAQPGILAAVIGGAVVGLLCAILVVMFIVYRMRKKDEGSYALDEPKRSPAVNSYAKNTNNREFYA